MIRKLLTVCACAIAFIAVNNVDNAEAQQGQQNSGVNYNKFYHYPYVTYPQNYWGNQYYRSADSLYYRYPAEMRVPVYNRHWHNFYPSTRRYHWGHHFLTDIF